MNKRNILIILGFLVSCICNAKEIKGVGNPKIYDIIEMDKIKIESTYSDDMILPQYEINLKLNGNYKILEFELISNYLFGKDLNLISSKTMRFDENSAEVAELNKKKNCSIKIYLASLKLEKGEKKEIIKEKHAEGIENEERISNVFTYVKYKRNFVL